MAKKKIGEIYNKPIVIGDKNEVEKHEIHIDELNAGGDLSDSYTYLDVSSVDSSLKEMLVNFSYVVKLANFQIIPIVFPIMLTSMGLEIPDLIAVCIDEQMYVDFTMGSDEFKGTIGELLSSKFGEEYNNSPRITKEEFYQVPIDIIVSNDDQVLLKQVYETLYSRVKTEEENTELVIPLVNLDYNSITLEDSEYSVTLTHIYKYRTNYENWTWGGSGDYYGTADFINLCESDGTNWAYGIAKVITSNNEIKYCIFNIPG